MQASVMFSPKVGELHKRGLCLVGYTNDVLKKCDLTTYAGFAKDIAKAREKALAASDEGLFTEHAAQYIAGRL